MIRSRFAVCLVLGCLIALPRFTRADDAPQPQRPDAGAFLKNAREKLNELNLTAEQKTKVDGIFANAETDLKRNFADAQSASPEERRQKFTEFMAALKDKVAGTLTDEQKGKFEQMTLAGPGGGAGAAGGQRQVGERFKQMLEKLDLSADQKEKVKKIMEEAKPKLEEIRKEAQSGDKQAVREKAMAAMREVYQKVLEVLTPEQKQKFQELMASSAANGGRRRPGAGAGAGAGEKPASTESK